MLHIFFLPTMSLWICFCTFIRILPWLFCLGQENSCSKYRKYYTNCYPRQKWIVVTLHTQFGVSLKHHGKEKSSSWSDSKLVSKGPVCFEKQIISRMNLQWFIGSGYSSWSRTERDFKTDKKSRFRWTSNNGIKFVTFCILSEFLPKALNVREYFHD